MAKYFVSPYTKYYEELNGATDIVSKAKSIVEESSSLVTTITNLQSQLDSSEWAEMGYQELVTTTIPNLKGRFEILKTNLTGSLQVACDLSINTLLPLIKNLKIKDEEYESKLNELNSLVEPSPKYETTVKNGKTVDTGNVTSAYAAYEKKKAELTKIVDDLKIELEKLVKDIDKSIEDVKACNNSVTDFNGVSASSSSTTEIEGLELTKKEEELVAAAQELVEKTEESEETEEVPTESISAETTSIETTSTDTFKTPVDLADIKGVSYNNGKTILYNDLGTQEDGYSRKILTSHGKVVTVFQQGWCENIPFAKKNGNNLRNAGCGFNALAAIMSSKYEDITPEQVFVEMGREFMYASSIKKYLEGSYNIPVGSREEVSRYDYNAYKAHLVEEVSKGNMVMTTVNARNDNKYTNNSHWVAIVDYDPEKDEFYISDSADIRDYNAAPIDADRFLKVYSVNTNVIYIADDTNYAKYNGNL